MSFEILLLMAQEYADRHKEPQALPATIDTMAYAYQRICQGEDPWTALGDFSNAWYGIVNLFSFVDEFSPRQELFLANSSNIGGNLPENEYLFPTLSGK